MRHLVDLKDFDICEVESILFNALNIKKEPLKFSEAMKGSILATVFFEPSTRTQFSFQTAMYRLGGHVFSFSDSLKSSIVKGESFKDTIKIISGYVDFLVIRHFLEGSAFAASLFSSCPVINAGDGGHLHPTQTLTDLTTILEYKKRLNMLKIGICGDLKFGRTVHSLIQFLTRYSGNEFFLIPCGNLTLPLYIKDEILESGNKFFECCSLKEVIENLDILYMTRVQKERFKRKDYGLKDIVVLNEDLLKFAKKDVIIMHPLPKTDEISLEVDDDERAIYFKQALNGVFARMSAMLYIKSGSKNFKNLAEHLNALENVAILSKTCHNENCVTNVEKHIPKFFKQSRGKCFCAYCGRPCI